MTKAELSDELAKATGLTKQESAGIVETVFECITAALVKGNKVELRGFGGFKVRQHRSSGDYLERPEGGHQRWSWP